MSIMLRAGALALALLAGTALTAAPAMAGYDHWGKKSWNKKYGYKHGRKHRGYANRGWNGGYGGYGWKRYGYYGYPRSHYGWGWPYYRPRGGFSIYID